MCIYIYMCVCITADRFVSFVHACMLSLWSRFGVKISLSPPVSFIFAPRGVVSCILCDLGFCENSQWFLESSSELLMSLNEFSMLSCFIDFSWVQVASHWVLSEFLWLLMSSDEFKRGLSEFRWVLSEFLWILVSSTEFLWGLLSSSEFKRAPESSQWVVVSSGKL